MPKSKKSALPLHNKQKNVKAPPSIFSPGTLSPRSFPLSPYTVLGSFLLWIFIGLAAYKCLLYFGTYRSLDSDLIGSCDVHLKKSLEENLKIAENYSKGDAGPYLKRIGSQMYGDTFAGTPSPQELPNIPPVVTAVSSAEFFQIQGLIRDIEDVNKSGKILIKLIIYDLGLYRNEKEIMKKHCNCDVRSFDAGHYPNHVAVYSNKAYQPIIMQTILEEFGSVMWIDPSVKFKEARDLGMLRFRGSHDFFLWEEEIFNSIVAYTHPQMFEFLGEKRCTFAEYGMMDTSSIVLYRTNMTWIGIMKPWLKCALNANCLSPRGAKNSECFHWERPKMTGCHWFVQSAFSIVVNRVFQFSSHIDKLSIPRFTTKEDVEIIYHFPEQPWTYSEIVFVLILPVMVCGALFYMYQRRTRAQREQYLRR
ncbi:uncharacterized protein LOC134275805 [Saccostrea cucullata]|uniref:uncharacterized protein LOC134275805 n=1 Tax=Saccostrea cuccullata TaxID=36930 RepID=UPI002ED07702